MPRHGSRPATRPASPSRVTDADGAESLLASGHADLAGTPLRSRPPAPDRLDLEVVRRDLRAPARARGRALTRRSRSWSTCRGFGSGGARADHAPPPADAPVRAAARADPGPSSPALIAELAAAETEWEPGTRFWYSNVGYDALGFALEAARRAAVPGAYPPAGARAARDARLRRAHRAERPPPARRRARAPPPATCRGIRASPARDRAVRAVRGRVRQHPLDRRRHGPLRPPPARAAARAGFDRMIDGVPDDEGIRTASGSDLRARRPHSSATPGGMVGYVAQMLCDMDDGVGAIALTNGPAGATTSPSTPSISPAPRRRRPRSPTRPPTRARPGARAGRYGPITVDAEASTPRDATGTSASPPTTPTRPTIPTCALPSCASAAAPAAGSTT